MKKIAVFLCVLFLSAGSMLAQEGVKKAKEAARALSAFKMDPSATDKLSEAIDAIDIASEDAEAQKMASTWITRAKAYNAVATQVSAQKAIGVDPGALGNVEDPATKAFQAINKSLSLSEAMGKKGKKTKTEAMKMMAALQSNLYNEAIYSYEAKNFNKAMAGFQAVLDLHDKIKGGDGKGESFLDAEGAYDNQLYVLGLSALNAGNKSVATTNFNKLYESGFDKPAIYESLYKLKADDDMDAAYKVLSEGREKYPDDVSLLFAEINHYLKAGKLDQLIGKLEQAIAAEPDNMSLYTTMGNVYDNLYQSSLESGDNAKATGYFDNAKSYYSQALEKDPGNFDATYSLGALYYNKAAAMTKDLNALADDYSKEGIKKYDALQKKVEAQFDEAMPYFITCEKANPNDINTLIALREIVARKNQLDKVEALKARLEKVQAGGTNETSFFKE